MTRSRTHILRCFLAICLAGASVACSGCLSLGGRTTYVHESPESLDRIQALEGRVSALERTVYPAPSPPSHHEFTPQPYPTTPAFPP